jgi:tetratricopeptide (TPR) repeat protein
MIEGRYAAVARLNAEATRVATALGDRLVELLAVAQLTMVRWHQGRMGEVEDAVRRFVDGAPGMPAWRAALARVYLDQGRDADARREFERLGERGFDQLPRYNGWLGMMALLADLAAQLGAEQQAAALYQLLLPFAARNVVTPYTTFDGPVTRYLGVLASTAGDHDSAEQHFAAAEDAVTRINAPLFRALTKADRARMLVARDRAGDREAASRLLEESEAIASALGLETIAGHMRRERDGLGEAHGAPVERKPAASPAAKAYVRREGDVWAFYFDGRTVRVRDSKGIRHLKLLLCNPGVEMHALQLASAESEASLPAADGADGLTVSTADDAGPVLDRQAKQAYRERLEELRRELEEAEAFDDRGRVEKLREEIDFVEHELAGAIGLGGRDRRASSEAERARVTVTKAIRSSIRKLSEHDPHLGRELEATVRTGTFCAYEPDPRRPIAWHSEST